MYLIQKGKKLFLNSNTMLIAVLKTEAQAQTIAHRVNVHDELVAALKLIDSAAKDSKSIIGFSAIVFKSIPQIRAALERAKQ